jgi:hypothetical protein
VRLQFGRRGQNVVAEEAWVEDEVVLPDMDAAEYLEAPERPDFGRSPRFQYESAPLHPAGTFTAELVGWHQIEGDRVRWLFETRPDNDESGARPHRLEWVTGTVLRPENNLCWVLAALGVLPAAQCGAGADPAAVREAVAALNPDELLGRQCRIQVGHVRDDLGNTTARIETIAARGAM